MKHLIFLLFCTLITSTAIGQDENVKIFEVEMRDSMLYGGFLFPKFDGDNLTFTPIQITGIPANALSDSLNRFISQLDTAFYSQRVTQLTEAAEAYNTLLSFSKLLVSEVSKIKQNIEDGRIKNRKTKSGFVVPEPDELCPDLKCKSNETKQALISDTGIVCNCLTKASLKAKK